MEITRNIKNRKNNISGISKNINNSINTNNNTNNNTNILKINLKLRVFDYIQESKYKPEEVLGVFTNLENNYIWNQTHKYKKFL